MLLFHPRELELRFDQPLLDLVAIGRDRFEVAQHRFESFTDSRGPNLMHPPKLLNRLADGYGFRGQSIHRPPLVGLAVFTHESMLSKPRGDCGHRRALLDIVCGAHFDHLSVGGTTYAHRSVPVPLGPTEH